ERNLIIEVGHRRRAAARRALATASTETATVAAIVDRRHGKPSTLAAAGKQRQLAAVLLQDDLGRIALLPRLVRPFPGLELPLEISLRALFQELLDDVDEPVVEDHDAMPFGPLAALAGIAVAPGLRGRDREIGDTRPVLRAAYLRVAPEIADKNDRVDAYSHEKSHAVEKPLAPGPLRPRPPKGGLS